MADVKRLDTYNFGPESPAVAIVPVSPSDTLDLPDGPCRGLLVGVGGNATIIDASGNIVPNVPLQQGYNPIAVRRVNATGIGASAIFALY